MNDNRHNGDDAADPRMKTNDGNPADPEERLPWEQRVGESAPAFKAFATYRDMGAERSINKVAVTLKKSVSMLEGWSRTQEWVGRSRDYDAYLDRIVRQAREAKWRVANARHMKISGKISEALLRRLEGDAEFGIEPLDPGKLDWKDLRRLTKDVVAIERLVHGQPTDFALRATAMTVESALEHVTTLIELARKHMEPDQFQALVVDYAAATAQATGDLQPGGSANRAPDDEPRQRPR